MGDDALLFDDKTPLNQEIEEEIRLRRRSHCRFIVFGVMLFGVAILCAALLLVRYDELDDHPSPPPRVRTHTKTLRLPTMGCTHPIYCNGTFLAAVQLNNPPLFSDQKTFVDMPCRFPPEVILANYHSSVTQPGFDMSDFVATHFLPAGSEVVSVMPPDFTPNPSAIQNIKDPNLRQFGWNVNQIWKNLTRSFNTSLTCGPACLSSMPLPRSFVVPGGRFREFYYWDTYWILHGLLVSQMNTTARGILENLFFMIDQYGFVPNGARIYYLDRSQPPLLTQMVDLYVSRTQDTSMVKEALPFLLQEHQFWMETEHSVSSSAFPEWAVLNRYFSETNGPRPESYKEDIATAASMPTRAADDMYSNLATGAETGWDYSTRWFADSSSINTIEAQEIVPVDLNVILLQNELKIVEWTCGTLAPDEDVCSEYEAWSSQRKLSITKFLMTTNGVVRDFDLSTSALRSNWYASAAMPLVVPQLLAAMSTTQVNTAVNELVANIHVGGLPVSNISSGQQWDFPNVWAPNQYFAILALEATGHTQAAFNLAQSWINTTYCGFKSNDILSEKYNATSIGTAGNGGEYVVQAGFGWTNGLILWILDTYGNTLTAPNC